MTHHHNMYTAGWVGAHLASKNKGHLVVVVFKNTGVWVLKVMKI